MPQAEAITALVQVYNETHSCSYRIASRPDEVNRETPDIDACAVVDGMPTLAIEHTHVETMASQMLDDARFSKVFLPLADVLESEMPAGLEVILEHGALQPGQDWPGVADAMAAWLRTRAGTFPVGLSRHDIAGVPFSVAVLWPRLRSGIPFHFARMAPQSAELRPETVGRFEDALRSKDAQMRKYAESGATTVLLVESRDWALVSPLDMHDAYSDARTRVGAPHIHQVWFTRLSRPDLKYSMFCFDGPQELMDAVNPRNLGWRSTSS